MKVEKVNAIIWMGPHKSHFISALSLARALQHRYDITFLGPPFLSEFVNAHGWQYKEVPLNFLHPKITLNLFFVRVLERLIKNPFNIFLTECQMITRTCKLVNPRVVFIDAQLSRYYTLLKQLNTRIVVVQPMLSSRKAKGIPPLTSRYLPSLGRFSFLYTEALWCIFFLKKAVARFRIHLGSAGINHSCLMAKFPGYDKRDFSWDTAGPPGVVKSDEVNLYSSVIEFPWKPTRTSEIYFGPAIDLSRKELIEPGVHEYLSDVKKNNAAKLIYCSFGFVPRSMRKHHRNFLLNLCDIATRRNDWHFIVASSVAIQTNNRRIKFVNYAPQLKILEHADVMITHGGLNSIQECILFTVPMLVYPLVSYADHLGVSIRVEYHKIGLVGNIRRDIREEIIYKISKLLTDSIYKTNLKKMNEKIEQLEEQSKCISRMISIACPTHENVQV